MPTTPPLPTTHQNPTGTKIQIKKKKKKKNDSANTHQTIKKKPNNLVTTTMPTAHQNPTRTKTHIKKKKNPNQPKSTPIKTQTVVEQNSNQPWSKHNTQNPNIKKTLLLSKTHINAEQNTTHKTHPIFTELEQPIIAVNHSPSLMSLSNPCRTRARICPPWQRDVMRERGCYGEKERRWKTKKIKRERKKVRFIYGWIKNNCATVLSQNYYLVFYGWIKNNCATIPSQICDGTVAQL